MGGEDFPGGPLITFIEKSQPKAFHLYLSFLPPASLSHPCPNTDTAGEFIPGEAEGRQKEQCGFVPADHHPARQTHGED